MKRLALLSLLAASALVLSACGNAASAAEPTAQLGESTEPTAVPTVTVAVAGAPTPAPTAAANESTRVEVTLADNTITSSATSFKAGVAYTFVIANTGRHEHNFNIAPPVASAGGYSEDHAQALLTVDEDQIPPGGSTSIEFTFPQTAVGMALEFNCLIRRHYEDGMRLDITVTN